MKDSIRKNRIRCVVGLIVVLTLVISARLTYLQAVRGTYYSTLARRQAREQIEVRLPRAALLDRNGLTLAASVMGPSLYTFDPQEIKDKKALAKAISSMSGAKQRTVLREMRTRTRFTWLARQMPFSLYPRAKELCKRFPGVMVMDEPVRYYPNGKLAANLLGCMGMDGGLSGLEYQWNKQLKGGTRKFIVARDAVKTRLIPTDLIPVAAPKPRAVRLTIDVAIQSRAESVLDEAVSRYGARDGVVIVMDCRNGDILAMAVRPTFDPNNPLNYPASTWRNRAVTDSFPPGSTMKIVTLASALDSGIFTAHDTVYVGDGTLRVGSRTIHDDEPPAKPVYSLSDVLVHSSNVGAAKIGMRVGAKTLYHYMRLFGFGQTTPLALAGETAGLLRPPEQWTSFSLPALSFGQEMRATPLQLITAFGLIASGGRRVTPRLLMGKPSTPGEPVLKASTVATLKSMMRRVVTEGTGKRAFAPGVEAAGKTGTAQKIGIKSRSGKKLYTAYFVGFAPASDPRIVVLVMVDEPSRGVYGGTIAAPVFARVAAFSLKRLSYPESDIEGELAMLEKKR